MAVCSAAMSLWPRVARPALTCSWDRVIPMSAGEIGPRTVIMLPSLATPGHRVDQRADVAHCMGAPDVAVGISYDARHMVVDECPLESEPVIRLHRLDHVHVTVVDERLREAWHGPRHVSEVDVVDLALAYEPLDPVDDVLGHFSDRPLAELQAVVVAGRDVAQSPQGFVAAEYASDAGQR